MEVEGKKVSDLNPPKVVKVVKIACLSSLVACIFFLCGLLFMFGLDSIMYSLDRPDLEFKIVRPHIAYPNISGSQFSANWDVEFAFKEDSLEVNRHYHVEARVYYKEEFLASKGLEAFKPSHSSAHEWKSIRAKIAATGSNISNSAASAIASQLGTGSLSPFTFELQSDIVYYRLRTNSLQCEYHMVVTCGGIEFQLFPDGSMTDEPSRFCKVHLFRK